MPGSPSTRPGRAWKRETRGIPTAMTPASARSRQGTRDRCSSPPGRPRTDGWRHRDCARAASGAASPTSQSRRKMRKISRCMVVLRRRLPGVSHWGSRFRLRSMSPSVFPAPAKKAQLIVQSGCFARWAYAGYERSCLRNEGPYPRTAPRSTHGGLLRLRDIAARDCGPTAGPPRHLRDRSFPCKPARRESGDSVVGESERRFEVVRELFGIS
jgi:hypothetical protein